jgi:hypothetical protein
MRPISSGLLSSHKAHSSLIKNTNQPLCDSYFYQSHVSSQCAAYHKTSS